MADILSNNPVIKKLILDIISIIKKENGYINPLLKIVEFENNFSIIGHSILSKKEKVIIVPDKLLPKLHNYDLSLKNDKITIENIDKNATSMETKMLKLQLDIYNEADKISQFKVTSLKWALKGRDDVLDKITKIDNNKSIYDSRYDIFNNNTEDGRLLNDFISSRKFLIGSKNNREKIMTLMPIIDYLNHNSNADSYFYIDKNLFVLNSYDDRFNKEIFVKYSKSTSPFLMMLNYGFIDRSVDRFYSRPISIEFGDKKFIVKGYDTHLNYRNALKNEPLKDLGEYMPYIKFEDNKKKISFSTLIIPGENAPLSMRRIIYSVISSAWDDLPKTKHVDMMIEIENEIINVNREFAIYLKSLKSLSSRDKVMIKMLNEYGIFLEEWLFNYINNPILRKFEIALKS